MPVVENGDFFERTAGPGGRIIPGWSQRLFCSPDDGPAYSGDDPEKLRGILFGLMQGAETAVTDRFLIIERSGQHFMQCLRDAGGWLLEKREGDDGQHFRALAPVKDLPDKRKNR